MIKEFLGDDNVRVVASTDECRVGSKRDIKVGVKYSRLQDIILDDDTDYDSGWEYGELVKLFQIYIDKGKEGVLEYLNKE